jgi:riboflavin kinase / FMN adenylyltransferase
MRIVRGLESFRPDAAASVVALGAFDGIHLGHRAILGTAVARARGQKLLALACTFDRHPMEVLQPDRAPLPITTLDERLELIAETGIDTTVVIPFTRSVAGVEAQAFVQDVLVGTLKAQEIVVGFNHRFGRGARGDAALLEHLAGRLGFRAHIVPAFLVDDIAVSSSEIRGALQRGDLPAAARLLGRHYSIRGEVVRGAGRGRTLGFPTANVRTERPLGLPPGVYVCDVLRGAHRHLAVVNVGVRPTFGEAELAVEAHLLDFTGDLYDQRVTLVFLRRLRDERKFPNVEALKEQIALDVASARAGSAAL